MARERRYTVYIVDDDDAVRDSLAALLETEGYATQAFATCREFSARFRPRKNACLLLEMKKPRHVDGGTLACVSDLARRLPVVVLSGSFRDMKARILGAGAAAVLQKPLDSGELMQLLRGIFV